MPGLRMVDHSPGTNSNRDFRGHSLLSSPKFFQSLTSQVLAARLARTSNSIAAPFVLCDSCRRSCFPYSKPCSGHPRIQQAPSRQLEGDHGPSTSQPPSRQAVRSREVGRWFVWEWWSVARHRRRMTPGVRGAEIPRWRCPNSAWTPSISQPYIVHPPSSSSPHPRHTALEVVWTLNDSGMSRPYYIWRHQIHRQGRHGGRQVGRVVFSLRKVGEVCGLSSKAGCRTLSSDKYSCARRQCL